MPVRRWIQCGCVMGGLAAACLLIGAQAPAVEQQATNTRIVADNLFDVAFVGESEAWITGYFGTVLHSNDRGQSWRRLSIEGGELLRRGAYPAPGTAWLVGHRGSIYFSGDAGHNWTRQYQEAGMYLRDIAFVDTATGWAVGHEGRILRTGNGGEDWTRQSISDWTKRDLPRLSGIAVIDRNTAVAAGEFGVLAYTRDAGQTWRSIRIEGDPTLTSITAHQDQFTAVGLDGVVVSARFNALGELEAKKLPLDIPTHLLSVRATSAGLLASGFGVVVHCGQECRVMKTHPDLPANFLWFGGANLAQDGAVWAVGLGGTVARAESVAGVLAPAFVLGGKGSAERVTGGDAS